ncbi:hypothetical protein LZ30DRAFT_724896 [Colletotrichum cereale]|nr:hypothetical protein LZ30DRAFT_724896 [Colletotrichum cereale]
MRTAPLSLLLPSLLSGSLAQETGVYPSCALSCVLEAIPQTPCAATNQTCLCQDLSFSRLVEPCVGERCTIKESLVTANITAKNCDFPDANESERVKLTSMTLFFILPTVSIILRMIVKSVKWSAWGADDSTILPAYVILIGFVPVNIFSERNGAGNNVWTLSFDQLDQFFLSFYISQALYYVSLALIKASILFMFLRIFPGDRVRLALWGTQAVNLMMCLACLFAALFQCQPLSLAWKSWSRDRSGRCINQPHLALSHGLFNVALDVWMLILPVIQIWRLNMKLRQKLGYISMFCLGIL